MIKKILDWILGKNSSASTTTPHPLDGATRAAEEKAAPYKIEAPVAEPAPVVETPAAEPLVAEVAPVTVKAKYKKAELNKKTKKELLDIAATHGVAVKARASKEELVKTLAKI